MGKFFNYNLISSHSHPEISSEEDKDLFYDQNMTKFKQNSFKYSGKGIRKVLNNIILSIWMEKY